MTVKTGKIKVLFDYSAFTMQPVGGVSRSMVELFKALSSFPELQVTLFAGIHQNAHLLNLQSDYKYNIVGIHISDRFYKQTVFKPLNFIFLGIYSFIFKPDIHQLTYYGTPFSGKRSKKVVYIHDFIHEKFSSNTKEGKKQAAWKKSALDFSDAAVCVSINTEKDLTFFYNEICSRVTCIPHGVSLAKTCKHAEISSPFLLYVGNRHQPYKNFHTVLTSLSLLSKFPDLSLICFGGGPFTTRELSFFSDKQLIDRISHVGGGDEALSAYYQQAAALIYPSTYEGFGLPPLEAMSLGCPVISSSAPPMNTLLDGAALFFDPKSPQELAHQIQVLLEMDDSRLRELINRGERLAAEFTWEKAGTRLYNVYKDLLDSIDSSSG